MRTSRYVRASKYSRSTCPLPYVVVSCQASTGSRTRRNGLRRRPFALRWIGPVQYRLAVIVLMPALPAIDAALAVKGPEHCHRYVVRTAAQRFERARQAARPHRPALPFGVRAPVRAAREPVSREQFVHCGRVLRARGHRHRRQHGERQHGEDRPHRRGTSSVGIASCGRASKCGLPFAEVRSCAINSSAFSICGSIPERSSCGAISTS